MISKATTILKINKYKAKLELLRGIGLGGSNQSVWSVFFNNKLIVHVPCLQIRVFTYLVGNEKGATDGPLKEISNDNRGI